MSQEKREREIKNCEPITMYFPIPFFWLFSIEIAKEDYGKLLMLKIGCDIDLPLIIVIGT